MKKLLLLAAMSALYGCTSQAELDMAQNVITALPNEVEGCEFIDNVDTTGAFNIQGGRTYLKLQTARLGGTHLVETIAYPVQMSFRGDLGVGLSGRAYKCPVGKGPKVYEPMSKSVMYESKDEGK